MKRMIAGLIVLVGPLVVAMLVLMLGVFINADWTSKLLIVIVLGWAIGGLWLIIAGSRGDE